MASITTRAGKGSPLTNAEVDANFTNINGELPSAVLTDQGDILYASAANTAVRLPKNINATRYLANTGTDNNPAWAQINLANGITGTLPVANGGTGITSFGTGVATFLGTPSSANLAAALTDETGTGLAVFGTNPTLTGVTLAGEAACADNLVTRATLKDYAIEGSAVGSTGATRTFDLSVANFFSATLDQACTFTFSNPPASGDFGTFVLELTNGGAFAITYPASVDFVGGVAPTLTASGVDQLVFTTRDGGTTYFGFVAGLDIKSP
jgi:hypothetical protein